MRPVKLLDNISGHVDGEELVYQAVNGGARVRVSATKRSVKGFDANGPGSQQTTQTINKEKTATLKAGWFRSTHIVQSSCCLPSGWKCAVANKSKGRNARRKTTAIIRRVLTPFFIIRRIACRKDFIDLQ
jgi:hypothetical protein